MNLSIFPKFCSAIYQQWPFSLPIDDVAISYCQFDKNIFSDLDFYLAQIDLPNLLQSAVNKRKAEYLAGRLCAREVLKKFNYFGYPLTQPDKSPLWPSSLCGSITHSQGLAAAVVARKKQWQSLGLDIEHLLDERRSEKLLSTITTQPEQKLINGDISLFTTLAFSIKESVFKALFPLVNKYFYFEHVEIIKWSKQGLVTVKLLIDLSDEWQKDQQINGLFCVKDNYLWSFIGIPALL